MNRPHVIILDPAVKSAELDCFNRLVALSPIPLTYHLPALFGTHTIQSAPPSSAGIIILGSASSVHDALPWQTDLAPWLLSKMEAGVPTLGLCFGHQWIAHLFGGEIQLRYPDGKKMSGFRQVTLEADALWGSKKTGSLFVSHREVVATCPNAFRVAGQSAEVAIEALAHKNLPIWSFQAHAEATPDFARDHAQAQTTESEFAFGQEIVSNFLQFVARRSTGS